MTREEARRRARLRAYFASIMVKDGKADGMVTGLTAGYAEAVRAPLEIIKTRTGRRAGGVYIVVTKNDFKFFADCTVKVNPTAEELAEIAVQTCELAKYFDVTPRVAMLSYSSFGSAHGTSPAKMREAAELFRQRRPDLEIDGEIQAEFALLGPRLAQGGVPVLDPQGGRQRLHLPEPRRGQHRLPAAPPASAAPR